jgi:tetratricopeptide (TPR) repeat protein/peroxiredoxin
MRKSVPAGAVDQRRRDFLIRCCQGASVALIPAGLGRLAFPAYGFPSELEPSPSPQFHLHPHYRTPMPLDAVLLKRQAGLDDFITEKYADQIAAILAQWNSGLLQSPQNVTAFEKVLLPDFSAAPLKPVESRIVRPGPPIEVRRNTFSKLLSPGRNSFLADLAAALSGFTKILTAEFQLSSVNAGAMPAATGPGQLSTRVRYEIVGTGRDFYREQFVGSWDLLWESSAAGEFRLRNWQPLEETQSRSTAPGYVDITAAALGGNASYAAQLLRGTDYWRTVLDGACGIDIYGNNGIALGDIDGDGFDDLYICQPAGLPNRLYRNRGDGTFEDITEGSGVGIIENTSCALFVDVDNDGRQDLVVVRSHGPVLFLNDGAGKFHQKPDAFRFATPPQGTFTGAAVADYDRDGWLDIYFCLYVYYQGTDQYKYPSPYHDAENGPPNFMMRNNRDGTFGDVTAESGLNVNNTRYSFCCGWSDFNRDGWPDLYVVNDFGRKNLYRNHGDGTFTDIAPEARVEDVGAGMGVCWFDYDNDGAEDLYVANMWTAAGERITMQDAFKKNSPADVRMLYHKHAMGNSLFHNVSRSNQQEAASAGGGQGVSPFEDRTIAAGVGIGRWAWSSDSWDFDHDGFADLYVTNGMISGPLRDDLNSFFWRQTIAFSPDQARPSHDYEQGWGAINELIRADGTWSGYERNIFYANNRDGTFSDVSGVLGLDFPEDGRAFALADFDLDGRQEVFLKNRNAPQLRVLKNVLPGLPPSIAFRLRGTKSNRDAIGAVVTIETEQGLQTRSLQAGSDFLSQHGKEIFFGLGSAKGPLTASIRWPNGLVQPLRDLPINHRIWVEEGAAPPRVEPFRAPADPTRFNQLDAQPAEALPASAETWLLAPIAAPDFSLPDPRAGRPQSLSALRGKTLLLHFCASGDERTQKDWSAFSQRYANWAAKGFQLLSVVFDDLAAEKRSTLASRRLFTFPILSGSDDVAGIYSILFHYLFDRRREIGLPTSFLIDAKGEIVKVYQGPVDPAQVEHDFRKIPQTAADRLARALPFPGIAEVTEFSRNYLSYGSVFFQRGYLDQAEASFQIAFRDDPESAEALYGIGSVYLNQQKVAEAQQCFERALKLRATYPDTLPNAWNNLGMLVGSEGRTAEAIADFQEALRLSPDYRIALNNLAKAYRVQRRWEDARQTYERSLQLRPDDAEANYGLGMVFAQTDDTERAFEFLQRALKARPVYPEAMNNLGILYLRTERPDQAVATFQEAIRVAPGFDQPYLNLARVYADEDTPDKARAVLKDLLQQHPDHPAALHMMEQLKQ